MSTEKFQISQKRLDEIILEEVVRLKKIKTLKTQKNNLLKEMHELYGEENVDEIFGMNQKRQDKRTELLQQRVARLTNPKTWTAKFPDLVEYMKGDENKLRAYFEKIAKNPNMMSNFYSAAKENMEKGKKYLDFWVDNFHEKGATPLWDARNGVYVSAGVAGKGGGGITGPAGQTGQSSRGAELSQQIQAKKRASGMTGRQKYGQE